VTDRHGRQSARSPKQSGRSTFSCEKAQTEAPARSGRWSLRATIGGRGVLSTLLISLLNFGWEIEIYGLIYGEGDSPAKTLGSPLVSPGLAGSLGR